MPDGWCARAAAVCFGAAVLTGADVLWGQSASQPSATRPSAPMAATAPAKKVLDPARRARAVECIKLAQEAMKQDPRGIPGEAFQQVALAQARLGDLDAAKATAVMGGGIAAVRALQQIACMEAESGDMKGAHQTMDAANGIALLLRAKAPSDPLMSSMLGAVGTGQAAIGEVDAAKETAERIGDFSQKAEVLAAIGEWQGRNGDAAAARASFAAAKKVLEGSSERDSIQKFFADQGLLTLVQAQMAAGDAVGAQETLQTINDPLLHARAEVGLGTTLAGLGQKEQSRATLLKARKELARLGAGQDKYNSRPGQLCWIGKELASIGDKPDASEVLAEAMADARTTDEKDFSRILCLAEIAGAQTSIGETAAGKAGARLAMDALKASSRSGASLARELWMMACQQALGGDPAAARETVAAALKAGPPSILDYSNCEAVAQLTASREGAKVDLRWVSDLQREAQPAAYAGAALGLTFPE